MVDSESIVDATCVDRGAGRWSAAKQMLVASASCRAPVQRREARAWRGENPESII
jgi:hypothetical protein